MLGFIYSAQSTELEARFLAEGEYLSCCDECGELTVPKRGGSYGLCIREGQPRSGLPLNLRWAAKSCIGLSHASFQCPPHLWATVPNSRGTKSVLKRL